MKKILLILCTLCFIVACKKSDDPANGSIYGFVKFKMGEDSTAAENIRLYLLNATAKIDTAECNNAQVIVDSVLTDVDGNYTFNEVRPGKYSVVPKFKPSYKITPIGRTFDDLIEVGENQKIKLNFVEEVNLMGSNLYISIRLELKNMKQANYTTDVVVAKYRRAWVLFVPYMQYVSTSPIFNRANWSGGTFTCSCQADIPRAMTFLCYSWDNLITFDLINSNNTSVTSPVVESFQCYLPFDKSSALISYDGKTKSVTYQ